MKCPFLILMLTTLLVSCNDSNNSFTYDSSAPYPKMNAGDFWPDKFDQRGLQNAIIYRDRIYCNTIDVGGENNFLYCLNPMNGLVEWRGHVKAYAIQPVSVQQDTVIYVSYLGDITAFNKEGSQLWSARFNHPYGGHWLDSSRSKLLVKTVYWKYVSEYDVNSGKLVSDNEDDSLQMLIEKNKTDLRLAESHEYRFKRNENEYIIKCRPAKPGEPGEYTIEIRK